jgi:hypothetical protein
MAQASVSETHPSVLPASAPDTAHGQPSAPPVEKPAAATSEQDSALEYESMVLLSKLEQLTIRLSDKMVHISKTLATKYLIEITNLLTQDVQNYAFIRPQHVHDGRLVLEDFADTRQDVLRAPVTFPELSKDMLRMINIYLSVFVSSFASPRMSEQWRTLFKGFYVSLTKTLRAIQGDASV